MNVLTSRVGHHVIVGVQADLGDDANWGGGFYELAVELGPRDDVRLEHALSSVWRHAAVAGCFAAEYHPGSGHEPARPAGHAPVRLSLRSLEEHGHLRGVVRIPSGLDIVCGIVAIRFEEGSDWLVFYVPLGALVETDSRIGGFPFGDDYCGATFVWRRPIDCWLAEVGSRVYADVPFRLGLIGCEVAAEVDADDVAGGAPECRDIGYLIPGESSLEYWEANR